MKKMLILAILALVVGEVSAQHRAGQWSLIPRVGLDLSKFIKNDVVVTSEEDPKVFHSTYKDGLVAGLDVEYFVHDRVGLSAGLYYMNMGDRFKDYKYEDEKGGQGFSNSRMTMDFLQLPIMGSLYVDDHFSVKLGVQFGHMRHSKTRVELQEWTFDEDGNRVYGSEIKNEGDFVDEWKQKFYFGIPVGISYEYQNVVVDARYVRSLTKVLKADAYAHSHHSTFMFTVGYRFNLP
ncbi:MAG: PorT family protein [Prevotella sp.]|nr:PorT family protein [Prevotella sp.]